MQLSGDESAAHRVAEILHGLLKQRRLLSKTAVEAGRDRQYYSDVLERPGTISLAAVLTALRALKIHPVVFLETHFGTDIDRLESGRL